MLSFPKWAVSPLGSFLEGWGAIITTNPKGAILLDSVDQFEKPCFNFLSIIVYQSN